MAESNRQNLRLKTAWAAGEIKRDLPQCGGMGFLFHATDWETVGFAFESGTYSAEELWEHGPFVASPVFFENRVIGANIVSPIPAEIWAQTHSGIRAFRLSGYQPLLQMASDCGLTHIGLGALLP